jgi:serine/threonine protein phosphatase PrpC
MCRVYMCNVGDSRTIMCRAGQLYLSSKDHKPGREDEAKRIREVRTHPLNPPPTSLPPCYGAFGAHRASADVGVCMRVLFDARQAGGFIFQNRVMGELAVSRAFGDKELKKSMRDIMGPDELQQMSLRDAKNDGWVRCSVSWGAWYDQVSCPPVAWSGPTVDAIYVRDPCVFCRDVVKDYTQPLLIAKPETLAADLTEEDQFILLACDGLFDVFSNQEVVEFITNEMRSHHDAQRACENISHTAIHKRMASDNVSIVLLVLSRWW